MATQFDSEVRTKMKDYWEEHSDGVSVVEMMLDNDAQTISSRDIDDVMSMVPELKGKRVLELGAGIGRYTGWLASHAKHVVAVDFIEKFSDKNRELNSHHGNTEFLCADATKLEFPLDSFDVVFSNWLLMYLNDEEVLTLFRKVLGWLSKDGYLFFRESCNKPSGNKKRGDNPTIYRKLSDYDYILNSVTTDASEDSKHKIGFELLLVRSNQAYMDIKKNPFQLCWLAQKTVLNNTNYNNYRSMHEFLDKHQYTKGEIAKFDLILGRDIDGEEKSLSTVGADRLSVSTAKYLALQPEEEVLDVGCGNGSDAFYLANEFGARMYAIDLSANMVERALEEFDNKYKHHNILFEMADATRRHFGNNRFDAIYCRDTLFYISDKPALFDKFNKWLKPSGRLVLTSLCYGRTKADEELTAYVSSQGYSLTATYEIHKMLTEAGFSGITVCDDSLTMLQQMEEDRTTAHRAKADFLKHFSEADFNSLVNDINSKQQWLNSGQLEWTVIFARKLPAPTLTPPKTPSVREVWLHKMRL